MPTADKGWGLGGKLATIHPRQISVFRNVTRSVEGKSTCDISTDTSKTKNPSLRPCSHLVVFLADLLHWQQTLWTTVFLEDGKACLLTPRREYLGKNYVTPPILVVSDDMVIYDPCPCQVTFSLRLGSCPPCTIQGKWSPLSHCTWH
jgi:hypothetical protein